MKRKLTVALTIILTVAASVVTMGKARTHNREVIDPPGQNRGASYLTKEVRHELVMLPYYSVFDWLQFEVTQDGTVVLQGQVTRPTLKSDAEGVVKGVEGVSKVVNQIEVLPLSPNDDRIRRAIYRALFRDNSPLFRYGLGAVPPIHIIVKNGNVILKGIVDSKGDSNLANIRANAVSGVFSVKNELVVANTKSK